MHCRAWHLPGQNKITKPIFCKDKHTQPATSAPVEVPPELKKGRLSRISPVLGLKPICGCYSHIMWVLQPHVWVLQPHASATATCECYSHICGGRVRIRLTQPSLAVIGAEIGNNTAFFLNFRFSHFHGLRTTPSAVHCIALHWEFDKTNTSKRIQQENNIVNKHDDHALASSKGCTHTKYQLNCAMKRT